MSRDRYATELNVSKLTSYLEFMLENTNKARKSVSESCEETRKVNKCWTFPDKDEESSVTDHAECTCHISAFEESSEEIAKGIGDIVENAQKIREKVIAKKSSLISTKENTNKHIPTNGANTNHKSNSLNSVPKSGGARNGLSSTSIPKLPVSRAMSTNIVKSTQLPVLKSKSTLSNQSTYKKDFASRPSSRLSNESAKSTASIAQGSVKSSHMSGDSPITMAQLEQLLDRVAVDATLYSTQTSTPNVVDAPNKMKPPPHEMCPIHGNQSPPLNPRTTVRHVDFKEAISVVGLPSKLVKILQPYHRFLSQQETGEKPTEPKSATRFLTELNNMNKSNWDESMDEPLAGIFANYLPVCSKVDQLTSSGERISSKDISRIRQNLEKLDLLYRNCLGKEISPNANAALFSPRQEACNEKTDHSLLALAGIWNDQSISFLGMTDAPCIRYNNVKQIKRFYQSLQRIQRLDFQSHLLDLIAKEIVPRLGHIDGNHAAYFLTVKTLIALCDLEHFKMPIIVKSN